MLGAREGEKNFGKVRGRAPHFSRFLTLCQPSRPVTQIEICRERVGKRYMGRQNLGLSNSGRKLMFFIKNNHPDFT